MPTIHETAAAIREGKLTPVDVLETCLKQIDRYEEKVRAWVLIDRDGAREQAEKLTAELKKGHNRGPLHGIPIGVKDIIDVFDWPTAAGSKLWANSIARQDAEVVKKLRQAGAIILGKTVTTAYASFDPPITRNPWNLSRTPGGSSSGSAAAVACGMCLGVLATQTGGSITRPASYCGVASIKPTYGRVSVQGVVPLAPSMDHIGFIAGDVRDLAIFLPVAASGWANLRDYTTVTELSPPTLRVGRFQGMFDEKMEPAMRKVITIACDRLREAGLEIVDCPLTAGYSEITQRHQMVMAVEAAAYHEHRLRKHPEDYPPRIHSLIEEGLGVPATEYTRTLEHKERLCIDSIHVWSENMDAIITPATPGPAPDASTTGSPIFNSPWSYTGLPTVSFPIGWSDEELPLAMQLVGRENDEADLLQMAVWCERAVAFERREPK